MMIFRDCEGNLLDDYFSKEEAVCFHCGEPSDAVWVAYTTIHVCVSCAIDVLPRLVADAIVNRRDVSHGLVGLEREVLLQFWKGLASAIAQGKQRDRKTWMADEPSDRLA